MALDVHVAGPGLDVTRRIEAGDPAMIIGRDTDCPICLPDPERNISRRHLSVWNEGGQLHFHILSVVNGVLAAGTELPPGARGVLQPGEAIVLAAFRITAAPVAVAPPPLPEFLDTWARLQADAEELRLGTPVTPDRRDDDPFGDWSFHSSFAEPAPTSDAPAPRAQLEPFFRGLGIEGAAQAALTQGELEALGRIARLALQGLVQGHRAAAELRRFLHADAEPTADARELNPLRMDTPLEAKLHYLFGGATQELGSMPPERALEQLAGELPVHEQAMGEAVLEILRCALAEFEPEAMKKRLLGGSSRLFESARAWDAFAREYGERHAAQAQWLRDLLERHFGRSYARALLRAKRNSASTGST